MNTAPHGVHIPLTVAYEGKPVLLETQEHLRTLRAYLDTWISIYEKAEKLPHLPQVALDSETPAEGFTESPQGVVEAAETPELVAAEAEQQSRTEETTSAPDGIPQALVKPTIDYIVPVLQAHGGSLPTEAVYRHLRALGWPTASSTFPKALRNLESIARKYKDRVTVSKGTISLVKPAAEDAP